jgi:hypothetical protein
VPEEHDTFFEVVANFDALVVRCNPGQINAAGGSQSKFDDAMRALRKQGMPLFPSPDVMEFMGAKDALTNIRHLNLGLIDTFTYKDPATFITEFKKTVAFQPRVIKQDRGSSGEGIWILFLKSENYCATFGDRSVGEDEVLSLMEMNDNHKEEKTVAEFIEWVCNGRAGGKCDSWTSVGKGAYFYGGEAPVVDQRFCPRIKEGEVRVQMVFDTPVGLIHKKPEEGGLSAVGGTGSDYTYYMPGDPLFVDLLEKLAEDLPKIMPSLGLTEEPVPLWWTADLAASRSTMCRRNTTSSSTL